MTLLRRYQCPICYVYHGYLYEKRKDTAEQFIKNMCPDCIKKVKKSVSQKR